MPSKDPPAGRPVPEEPQPADVPPAAASGHREAVIQQARTLRAAAQSRDAEIRLDMMRSVITEPLLSKVLASRQAQQDQERFDVILSLNETYHRGIGVALQEVAQLAASFDVRYRTVSSYCFACLSANEIIQLAQLTMEQQAAQYNGNILHRIWEDSVVGVALTRSLVTIKADAAQRSFQAFGEGIVWAVLDSGIDGQHPHFAARPSSDLGALDPLGVALPVTHLDFTPDGRVTPQGDPGGPDKALVDRLGHGSHVAGTIAGYWSSHLPGGELVAGTELRDPADEKKVLTQRQNIRVISGVAPKARLVSMKVIADVDLRDERNRPLQSKGQGKVSWVLQALDQIQQWNQYGRRLLVHGVNLSLGYDFDPRWFACGQSPICVEVNRLVRSGVVVVVAAGNAGYTSFVTQSGRAEARFNDLTIADPGNAELAITVGSTHKEMPHLYGVSYFSSRGPTGDGRMKPDLLAPGERILSCAAGDEAAKYAGGAAPLPPVLFSEQSGTSMAAPHVSGAVAAFLSVRPEFQGQPERVKEIFLANTVDLRRERCFQGSGLLDLMKVLQAV